MDDKWMIMNWTTGALNALVKNLGGEDIARKIQRGEVRVRLEEIIRTLFDKHGRRIPEGLSANVRDANWYFHLDQPKLNKEVDFVNRLARLHDCLGIDTGITAKQLKAETERLLAVIGEDPQIASVANGVHLSVVMPQLTTNDLGTELELYLAGVAKAYARTFNGRSLSNHCEGRLAGQVNIVRESRHDQLIERMKQGPVIGIHFASPLQGFSVLAAREQMRTLPEGFVLSGVDTAIATMMYADILARDWYTPGLESAALQWQSAAFSLYFVACAGGLSFGNAVCLAVADVRYSGGLLFLG